MRRVFWSASCEKTPSRWWFCHGRLKTPEKSPYYIISVFMCVSSLKWQIVRLFIYIYICYDNDPLVSVRLFICVSSFRPQKSPSFIMEIRRSTHGLNRDSQRCPDLTSQIFLHQLIKSTQTSGPSTSFPWDQKTTNRLCTSAWVYALPSSKHTKNYWKYMKIHHLNL